MLSDFTLSTYSKLLEYLKERYEIVRFCDLQESSPQSPLILRHDIDWSIEASEVMASMEANMGVKSTYFVLLSHKLYNVFDPIQFQRLKTILSFGHEIGLHYDASIDYGKPLEEVIRFEAKQLGYLLGTEVVSITRHNPAMGKKPFEHLEGYLNADGSVYSEDFLFISDSCRTWDMDRTPLLFSDEPPPKVQLLIHPALWQPDRCSREQVLIRACGSARDDQRRYLTEWLKRWRENPRVKKYQSGRIPDFLE